MLCENQTPAQPSHPCSPKTTTELQWKPYLEERDDVLRRAGELLAQLLLLGGDSHGAVVGVADARHDAALRDHGDRPEPCKHKGGRQGRVLSGDMERGAESAGQQRVPGGAESAGQREENKNATFT